MHIYQEIYALNRNTVNIAMLVKTPYVAPANIKFDLFKIGKHDLTQPTGDFFYDPWVLKAEYVGTVWEDIWRSLPINTGQARIIVLESPGCYTQHADIDDRYHLNLFGDEEYLIDLESQQMYKLKRDNIWYEMDAGKLHTAISIGEHMRMQLVVRKLLTFNNLTDPVNVTITVGGKNPRYWFDNKISPWLNRANKRAIINRFVQDTSSVCFDIERNYLQELEQIIPEEFTYEYR
jgi:hypothetical protein